MERYRQSSKSFHGGIAYIEQRKHQIDLLDSDRISRVHIIDANGHNNQNRQHQNGDIVQTSIIVEQSMIGILFDKVVIIGLYYSILPADHFCLVDVL